MKKTMAKATAVVLAAGMLAACGGGADTTSSAASGSTESSASTSEAASTSTEASGDATVIEVWSNNRHDEVYMTQMVDEFNATHSDVQIEYTILTDDWTNSIQLGFPGQHCA